MQINKFGEGLLTDNNSGGIGKFVRRDFEVQGSRTLSNTARSIVVRTVTRTIISVKFAFFRLKLFHLIFVCVYTKNRDSRINWHVLFE